MVNNGYFINEAVLRVIRWWIVVGLSLVVAISAFGAGEEISSARTNVIKAGMVNGFTSYTSWPQTGRSGPFVIGVMGQNALFIPALERFFEKKPVFIERQLSIRPISMDEVVNCQVVVLLGDANQHAKELISRVTNLPILTISDQKNFAELGGHVNFYSENNRLRFTINWQSTNDSKLKISSRLLRLANVVGKPQ